LRRDNREGVGERQNKAFVPASAGQVPSNSRVSKSFLTPVSSSCGKSGVQVKVIEFQYRTEGWDTPRRVVCKTGWHVGALFPRVAFIVTNSKPPGAFDYLRLEYS